MAQSVTTSLPEPSRCRATQSWTGCTARWVTVAAALLFGVETLHAQSQGESLYELFCSACHQPDGQGVTGIIPPLDGNPRLVSDDPDDIQDTLRAVVFGCHGALFVDGQLYTGCMPALGYQGRMTDDEVLDLVNYIRDAWRNNGRAVTHQELATAREAGRR